MPVKSFPNGRESRVAGLKKPRVLKKVAGFEKVAGLKKVAVFL